MKALCKNCLKLKKRRDGKVEGKEEPRLRAA